MQSMHESHQGQSPLSSNSNDTYDHSCLSTNSLVGNIQQQHYHQQQQQYDQDDNRMLFNFFLSKYNNTRQTQQQDEFHDDQSEDEDIRMFLEQQVPGLYNQQFDYQNQSQCQIFITNQNINQTITMTPSIKNSNTRDESLCVQYLGMNRWEKQEFFQNLNHIYMERMRCERGQKRNKNANVKHKDSICKSSNNRGNRNHTRTHIINPNITSVNQDRFRRQRGGIRFSEIVSEVVFSKSDQPSVVGRTQQQIGVIVFDDEAYEVEEQSSGDDDINSSISSSDNSDDGSSGDSENSESGCSSGTISNSGSSSVQQYQNTTTTTSSSITDSSITITSNTNAISQYFVDSRFISDSLPKKQQQNIIVVTTTNLNSQLTRTNENHLSQLQERQCKRLINGQLVIRNEENQQLELFGDRDYCDKNVQQINGRKLVHRDVAAAAADDNTCDSQSNCNYQHSSSLIVLEVASRTNDYQQQKLSNSQ